MRWSELVREGETRRLYMVCVVVLLVAGWLVLLAEANNLQEEDPLVLRPPSGQTGLHFGFSLAHYTINNERWLLVGAPRSNVSDPRVMHSGGLYKCQLSKSNAAHECLEVKVDSANTGPHPNWMENPKAQGLGFSLASDGKAVVVCAPQWYATKLKFNSKSYIPAGMCFAATSPDSEFEALSPPFVDQSAQTMSYLTTGSCQFGMSAAFVKGPNTFAFGAPGCWGWRGDTWEIGLDSQSSRLLGKPEENEIPNPSWESDSRYLGYSVASLKFGGENVIVSSMPRIAESQALDPTILILVQNPDDQKTLKVQYKISPSKISSDDVRFAFFGYSLATLDLNDDGLEDLVVGAPFYNNEPTNFDQGAIFIYMQTVTEEKVYEMKEEENSPQRMGGATFSRFGSYVAAIGDLDGDGYEDLAVGAPFVAENSDERAGTGAVYIYMGSHKGLEKDPRQIIKAASNQFGFGSSIAQLLPSIEGQGYDVAVGVYNSDTVLVFKSKEVVDVNWNLTFSGRIDLAAKNCVCTNIASLCPCVDAEFCLKYQKIIVKNENNVELGFNITLTAERADEIFFENGKAELQRIIKVPEGENYCKTFKILAKPGIKEIKSFIFEGDVNLDEEEKNVVLDRHSILKKREQLDIVINCTSGAISGCQSDIILQYDILDSYVLMTSQPMRIHFKVKNQGETAYESKLNIQSADEFVIHGDTGSEVICERNMNMESECKIGRIYNNSEVSFNLSLIPTGEFFSSLDTHAAVFDMVAQVKTLSTISNPDTARKEIKAPIIVEGSLQLFKETPQPGIVYYNSSSYYKSPEEANSEEELGPEIKHSYSILNTNRFSIYKAELRVHWPLTINGKPFLYLLENVSFSGISHIINCQYPSGMVDPFDLKNSNITRQTHGSQSYKAGASMRIGDNSPEFKTVTCPLGEIRADGEVTVSLRSRLVLRTLVELEVGTAIKNASSFVDLQITKMPLSYTPPEPSMSSLKTTISYQKESPEAIVPVWLYIVSTLGGLLLLGIIVIIMWKCGFFKRQRMKTPDNANENQGEKEEEGEQDDVVATPTSPMLKETENAAEDFEFHRA